MPLRESKGNMYPFVTHTWNPIKGRCSHDCQYCYMKRFPQKELHLDEKDLQTDLGSGHFIFVGSSTDMWAEDVPSYWIYSVLAQCRRYLGNRYLFQSKNPYHFYNDPFYFNLHLRGIDTIWGTTVETNQQYPCMGNAPTPLERQKAMMGLIGRRMVTVEPILDFDLEVFVELIRLASPEWVNIGADSQGHHLPDPSAEKVEALIEQLSIFTTVKIKSNLKRITGVNE